MSTNGRVRSLIGDMASGRRRLIAERRREILTELRRLADEDAALAAVEAAVGVETQVAEESGAETPDAVSPVYRAAELPVPRR